MRTTLRSIVDEDTLASQQVQFAHLSYHVPTHGERKQVRVDPRGVTCSKDRGQPPRHLLRNGLLRA